MSRYDSPNKSLPNWSKVIARRVPSETTSALEHRRASPKKPIEEKASVGASTVVTAGRLLTSCGYYLTIPLLAGYATGNLGMSAIQASALIAIHVFTRRGFAIPGGHWCDRLGNKPILLLGLAIEVAGYLVFAGTRTFPMWCIAVILSGGGGCLYNSASRTILATTNRRKTGRNFGMFYVTMYIGALVGPITGGYLATSNCAEVTFLTAAALYAVVAILAIPTLPRDRPSGMAEKKMFQQIRAALSDRWFVAFCLCMTAGWLIATQLYVALPLTVNARSLGYSWIGGLNTLNAVVTIIFIYPMGRLSERFTAPGRLRVLILGILLMSLGWLCCSWTPPIMLIIAVTIMSAGQVLFLGTVEVLASQFAPAGRTGLYLGFGTMAWAIGGGLGSILCGAAFQATLETGAISTFWVGLCFFGLSATLPVWLVHRRMGNSISSRTLEAGARRGGAVAAR
jgi:MFS transporter, DHA1 family, multidrug resistance protein